MSLKAALDAEIAGMRAKLGSADYNLVLAEVTAKKKVAAGDASEPETPAPKAATKPKKMTLSETLKSWFENVGN